MVVLNEIVDKFVTQDFIDITDEAVIDQLIATIYKTTGFDPSLLGLTREDLKKRLINAKKKREVTPEKIAVSPQKERQEARKRLDEKSRSITNKILQAIGLPVNAPQLVKHFPQLGATNNYAVVIQLVQKKVNERLGISKNSRAELSIEQIKTINSQLENVADDAQKMIEEKIKR